MGGDNGFEQYKLMILERLDRLEGQQERRFDKLETSIGGVKLEVVALKVKAGLAGLLAGALGSFLVGLGYLLLKVAG